LGGVKDKIAAGPARHFSALTGQMVNFLGTMQMEFAGAQAFNSVDTYLAPFVRYDNLNYRATKQLIQQMVFCYECSFPLGKPSSLSEFFLRLGSP
jgi:ribonucleoside-triphosphate reductase